MNTRRRSTLKLCAVVALALCAPPPAARGRASCPRVKVSCPDAAQPGGPLTFTAEVTGAQATDRLTFNWTVSAGQITGGQGTLSITVDTTGVGLPAVSATLEVGGVSAVCDKEASCATAVPQPINCHLPFDTYGRVSRESEEARLDNYAIALLNEPPALGYVFCYGGRRGPRGEAQARCRRAKDYLVGVRELDAARLVTVDGGYREDPTVQLWVVPAGASPPAATPTVDPAEVEFVEPPRRRRAARRP